MGNKTSCQWRDMLKYGAQPRVFEAEKLGNLENLWPVGGLLSAILDPPGVLSLAQSN